MSEQPQDTLMLMNVRAGRYVHLITARQGQTRDDGSVPEPKFEIEIILPKNHPQAQELKNRQKAAAQKKWGNDYENMLTALLARDRVLLHNGDATRIGKPEYAGMFYLNAKNPEQPTIIVSEGGANIATRGTPKVLLPGHKDWPYPGCKVNVELDIYAYTKGKNSGISATVLGVQFAGHDTRLGNQQVSSASRFGVIAATSVDGAAPSQGSSESLI